MSRPATTRLKVNPPLGRMPVLQFLRPSELAIDPSYQRSIEASSSQSLIRKIAQFWNWDLCQPLVVALRRPLFPLEATHQPVVGQTLFVIDGQHRLEAARMRGDISQLPCVVVEYASAADEAASFVHLNQQRRPLTALDLFKAGLASEDGEAAAIMAAITEAKLSLAAHSNYTAWKAGMVSNIGGIQRAWRVAGAAATVIALSALARGFEGQVLRYAGTIFPGIVGIVRDDGIGIDVNLLANMLSSQSQAEWRKLIAQRRADDPNLKFAAASEAVLSEAWDEWLGAAYAEEAA